MLAIYAIKNNHSIEWDGVNILDTKTTIDKRLTFVMYHINKIIP